MNHSNAPLEVSSGAGTRLAELHAAYPDLKAAADEADARLKACTDGIKAELTAISGEDRKIILSTAGLPRLGLTYVERWNLDSKKLKATDPETWVRYAKKSGSWTLKPLAAGGESE